MKRALFITVSLVVLSFLAAVSCRRHIWMEADMTVEVVLCPSWSQTGRDWYGCEAFIYQDGELFRRVLSEDTGRIPVRLPSGDYRAVVISHSEAEYGSFSLEGEDLLEGLRAVSAVVSGRAVPPEWLAAAVSEDFTVTAGPGGGLVRLKDFTTKPVKGTYISSDITYDVPIEGCSAVSLFHAEAWVRGARRVMSMSLYAGGLSSGWIFVPGVPAGESSEFRFSSWTRQMSRADGDTPDDGVFYCNSTTFGLPGDAGSVGGVSLDLSLSDGTVFHVSEQDVEVTKSVTETEDGQYRYSIIVTIASEDSPIILPPPQGSFGGAGIDAWVDAWQDEGTTAVPC